MSNRIGLYFVLVAGLVASLLGPTAMAIPLALPRLQAQSINAPILLIVDSTSDNKFGPYLGEILRAEGLNAFDEAELDNLSATQLAQYDVAILAETSLSDTQASMLTNYVAGGGALLAMRPDAQIASLFGLNTSAGTLNDGYLQIKGDAVFNGVTTGYGLMPDTLQIHGSADEYNPEANTVTLAQLYSDATSSTPYPAVVAANSGNGQAVAFTYDLASNVVYTRQGNPNNADMDVDGDFYTRTTDLFQTVDGGAPWIDRDKIPIPQADEQQRLFARIVQQLVGRVRPMPQLWYFPDTAKTMLILTSDAHWNTLDDYAQLIGDMNAHQGKITVYLSTGQSDSEWPADTDLQTWQTQGNSFGIHPWDISTLTAGFNETDNWFLSAYTVPRSNTVRIHRYEWEGWTSAADIAAAHNIALDTSFAPWGAWFQKADGTWPHGYMTGSGLPMKFVRADGTLTSVYQQLTNLTDDQIFNTQDGVEGLNGTQAVALSQSLIDASLAGNYSALTDLHHVDNYGTNADLRVWATGVVDYAHSKSVPVWNADQWLGFTQTRHDANYTNIAWNASSRVLSFNLAMTATPGLTPTTMLPLNYAGQPLLSVTIDGGASSFSVQTIKSVNVAFVGIPAGNHSVSATYGASSSTPTNTPTPTATSTLGPTPTNTPTPTSTPTPTNTPEVTPTNTPAPPQMQPSAASGTCPCSIWSSAVVPTQDAVTDGRSIEVGVKFRSDVDGYITGLRFYKGITNTGTHTGTLWSNAGTPLATATFTNETPSGWQEVTFNLPVAILSNTTYVASYFSDSGYFAVDTGYFATGFDNSPLHALASGVDGPNGVYQYDTSGFPTNGTNNNYWVDVVFTTIAWSNPADITYGTALGPTQLNATASVSGTFVYTPAPGTILDAGLNQVLHVDFTPADTTYYNADSKDVRINVLPASQTITFDPLADKTFGDPAFAVSATASSGLVVTFTVGGQCTITSTTVTLTGAGSCTVTAHQSGDANYTAAPDVAQSFNIAKAMPTVSVTGGTFIYDGQPHAASGFAYGVGGMTDVLSPTIELTYDGSSSVPINAGVYVVLASFAGNADYNSATNTTALTITKALPALMWSNPADITYGTALGPTQLNATASVSGTFVYTPATGTILDGGPNQVLHVDFTPDDTTNYSEASLDVTINVLPISQTITFDPLPDRTYGDPDITLVVTATSGLPVSFTVSGGACSILDTTLSLIAAGSCAVTAHQAGNPSYLPAPDVTRTFTVAQAAQTITFDPLPDKTIGDPPFTVVATATSSLPVSFTASGDCTVAGNTVTLVRAGSCTVTAHQVGDTDYLPALDVAQTFAIQESRVFLSFISANSSEQTLSGAP